MVLTWIIGTCLWFSPGLWGLDDECVASNSNVNALCNVDKNIAICYNMTIMQRNLISTYTLKT